MNLVFHSYEIVKSIKKHKKFGVFCLNKLFHSNKWILIVANWKFVFQCNRKFHYEKTLSKAIMLIAKVISTGSWEKF